MARAKSRHKKVAAATGLLTDGVFLAKVAEEVLRFSCTAVVIAFAIVTYQAVTTKADAATEFIRLQIVPSSASLTPGAEQSITALGIYHSRTAAVGDNITLPLGARWTIQQGGGRLEGCEGEVHRCLYRAGEEGGTTRIEARTEEGASTIAIDVIAPLEEEDDGFADDESIPGWANAYIRELAAAGIIRGFDPEPGERLPRFDPAGIVTRGQLVTLLLRTMHNAGLIADATQCRAEYEDVPADHFASPAIGLFQSQGWTSSSPTFEPDAPAPRGVTAMFIERSLGETFLQVLGASRRDIEDALSFDDVPMGSPPHDAAEIVRLAGVMTGEGGGTVGSSFFNVGGTLNRAQAAAVIYRIMHFLQDNTVRTLEGFDERAACAERGTAGEEDTVGTDTDQDGLSDANDNYPGVSNMDQANEDGDDLGDFCDEDNDNDGTPDAGDQDSCDNPQPFYPDVDRDGHGDMHGDTELLCLYAEGYSLQRDDCDDGDRDIHPGATEVCGNSQDDDCDGAIDEGCNTLLPIGAACTSKSQCVLGNCVDGVCCNISCTGVCETCDAAGFRGTCTAIPDGEDPLNECVGDKVCNGAHNCRP